MDKRRYYRQRSDEQKIAYERVNVLWKLAEQEYKHHPERSNRYTKMILDIVKKLRIRLPKHIKVFICKKCSHYLISGKNLRVRSKGGYTTYECLDCGAVRRYGYLREKGVKNE